MSEIEHTNLEPVTKFSKAIRARLGNLPAFRNHLKDDAALAEELTKAVTHALEQEGHHDIEVTAEEAYQWLAEQDIPRDDERGDAIYDALVEVLGLEDNHLVQFNSLHAAALSAIEAQEKLAGKRTEPLPLPAKGVRTRMGSGQGKQATFGVGSYGRAAGGGNADFDPNPCYETVHYPAIPPRMIILPNSNYADNYDRMELKEWKQIANSTENFFELLCCLRRMVEPARPKFSSQSLGATSKDDNSNQQLMQNEHGKTFPPYRNDKTKSTDVTTLKAIFSKPTAATKPYAEKLERLFIENKRINAAYAHTKNSYTSFARHLLYMPEHFYRDLLTRCNNNADETDTAIISATDALLPIYEQTHYRRMTRHALGLTAQEVGDAIGCAEHAIQFIEDPEKHNQFSKDFYKKLHDYYEQKHDAWLAEGEAQGKTRTPFFDSNVLDALPNLSNEQITEKWQADDPGLFEQIERNVAFNTKIANKRDYRPRRRKPEAGVDANTVTGEGLAANDVVSKEL